MSIDVLVNDLKLHKNLKGAIVLIGAGASVSAGIPLAAGFVEQIRKTYAAQVAGLDPAYPAYMARLHSGSRRDLVQRYVKAARVNWAHLALAQLMLEGYVRRVLTTNFDPLLTIACHMVGLYPAVYDLAAIESIRPGLAPDGSIFHLHGIHYSFVQLHTAQEVDRQYRRIAPLFNEAGQHSPWIVAGYSGDQDPVFRHLTEVDRFEYGLTWAGYRHYPPPEHVRRDLLDANKDARLLSGYDADSLFVELATRLGCFPPEFIQQPIAYIRRRMAGLAPFQPPEPAANLGRALPGPGPVAVLASADALLDRAQLHYEDARSSPNRADDQVHALTLAHMANVLLMSGRHEEAIERLRPEHERQPSPAVAYSLANALRLRGLELLRQAPPDIQAAILCYTEADTLLPGTPDILNSWGNALWTSARLSPPDRRAGLFQLAEERYRAALSASPDVHFALHNLAGCLTDHALMLDPAESLPLLVEARRLFERCLDQRPPGLHQTLNGLAIVLVHLARRDDAAEPAELLEKARGYFQQADELVPGFAAYSLGCLAALRGDLDEAQRMLTRAAQTSYLPRRQKLETDTDLDPLRRLPWFSALTGLPPR